MGIVRRSFVAVWPLRLGAIVVGLGPGRVLLVARLGVVPPSRAAGGCWGRGVAGLREADVLRQRRRLRALEQRREPRDQRGAGDRSGGEPRDVRPADPSAASHLRFRTPDAGAAPPGRYSRPPLWPSPSTSEYELVLMLDPELPDERREQIAAEARTADRVRRDAQARHLVGHAQARLRDPPAHRGRLPPLPLREAERAARRAQPQPADRRRRPALPDLQGRPRLARDRSTARRWRTLGRAHPRSGAATGRRPRQPPRPRASPRRPPKQRPRLRASPRLRPRQPPRRRSEEPRSRRRRHGGRRAGARGRSGGARGAASPESGHEPAS